MLLFLPMIDHFEHLSIMGFADAIRRKMCLSNLVVKYTRLKPRFQRPVEPLADLAAKP